MQENVESPPDPNSNASYSLLNVKLREIVGIHPLIEVLFAELKIPPLRFPSRQAKQDNALRTFLSSGTIGVVREGKKLYVTGNLRFFLAMRAVLAPNDEVLCIQQPLGNPETIRLTALQEFLYLPAVSGVHFGDESGRHRRRAGSRKMSVGQPDCFP